MKKWYQKELVRSLVDMHIPNIEGSLDNFDPIKYAENVKKITQLYKPGDTRDEYKFKRLYSTKKHTVDEDNIEESCQKII